MRENATTKARRYLTEGRLIINKLEPAGVTATCRGDGQIHLLGWRPDQGWWCTCPARGTCSHLLALRSVVALDLEVAR
jgi:hypothetical protein